MVRREVAALQRDGSLVGPQDRDWPRLTVGQHSVVAREDVVPHRDVGRSATSLHCDPRVDGPIFGVATPHDLLVASNQQPVDAVEAEPSNGRARDDGRAAVAEEAVVGAVVPANGGDGDLVDGGLVVADLDVVEHGVSGAPVGEEHAVVLADRVAAIDDALDPPEVNGGLDVEGGAPDPVERVVLDQNVLGKGEGRALASDAVEHVVAHRDVACGVDAVTTDRHRVAVDLASRDALNDEPVGTVNGDDVLLLVWLTLIHAARMRAVDREVRDRVTSATEEQPVRAVAWPQVPRALDCVRGHRLAERLRAERRALADDAEIVTIDNLQRALNQVAGIHTELEHGPVRDALDPVVDRCGDLDRAVVGDRSGHGVHVARLRRCGRRRRRWIVRCATMPAQQGATHRKHCDGTFHVNRRE